MAIVAMWIAINGMSGGNFSLPYFISLFSGFYIMVRGLQNLDDGLKERREMELANGIVDGPAHGWVDLWEALFYGSYGTKRLEVRLKASITAMEKTSLKKIATLLKSILEEN